MEEKLSTKISGVDAKVRQLAAKLHSLEAAYNQLQKENKKLESELVQKNTELFELEKRTKALPLAQKENRLDKVRAKKMKKEIAQHLKEIDKCIEWLQNS